jgi:hypothetical protein
MDADAIVPVIEAALTNVSVHLQGDHYQGLPSTMREGVIFHECSHEIEAVLTTQPEFAKLNRTGFVGGLIP